MNNELLEIAQEFSHRETSTPYLVEGEIELHLAVLKKQISQTAAKKALETRLKKNIVYQDRFKIAIQEACEQGLIKVELL